MMDAVVVAIVVCCYAAAATTTFELRGGRRVAAAGALGPVLIALGPHAYEVAPLPVLIGAGAAAEVGLRALGRKPIVPAVWHAALLAAVAGVFATAALLTGGIGGGATSLLAVVVFSCALYGAVEFFRGIRASGPRASRLWDEARSLAPTLAVLLSAAGLGVLVFPQLGWVTFPLLLLPLLAVQQEFGRSAEARRAYDQTVGALGRLTERAGYAPAGHHERVTTLAVAVGEELGLSREEIERLRAAARLHLVGAVSLGDPDASGERELSSVFEDSARVLKQTGYLAPHANVLADAAAERDDAPLPGRILRIASTYERAGPSGRLTPESEADMHPDDRAVLVALRQVLERSSRHVRT